MKLLYCPICGNLFNLNFTKKSCDCGLVSGRYINKRYAITNGKGVCIAIGNGSLQTAIYKMQQDKTYKNTEECVDAYKVNCWVRPHEGPKNPHTSIGEVT